MSDTIEKLEDLIEERLAAIAGHKGTIDTLQEQIEQCEGEIRGLELALKLCKKSEPDSLNGSPALIGKYADVALTDAIIDAVNSDGSPQGMTARELVEVLKAEGFRTKLKDLYNSTYPTAMGLVESGKILEGKKNGKRSFMRKQ